MHALAMDSIPVQSLEALCPPRMSQRQGQLQIDLLDPLGFLCLLINAAGTLVCYIPCYSSHVFYYQQLE